MDGEGILTWPSGAKYDGSFKNNKFNGSGEMIYRAGGGKYNGQWKNDKRDGEGEMIFAN